MTICFTKGKINATCKIKPEVQILSLGLFPPLLSVREYKDKNTGACVWKCNKNMSYFHVCLPTASTAV